MRRLAASVSPNPLALRLALGLATLETVLAGWASPYAGPADALAAWVFLAALWLVAIAVLVGVARAADLLPPGARTLAGAVGSAAFAGVVVLYAVSWRYRFVTGEFVGVDAARFAWAGGALLAPGAFWAIVGGALFIGLGLALFLPRLAGDGWDGAAAPSLARRAVVALLVAAVALGAARWPADGTSRAARLDPVVALALDAGRASAGPVRPVLAPRDLVARAGTSAVPRPPVNAKLRPVVLIGVESLRRDAIGGEYQQSLVMPRLTALSRAGRVFSNAWATSTHSTYSGPSVPSSLYPLRTTAYHSYAAEDPWPRTLVWDALKPAGYATALVSSQNESWGGMHEFLATPAVDLFYDPERSKAPSHVSKRDVAMVEALQRRELHAGSFHDEHTVGVAIDWMRQQKGRPFLLAMKLQALHFPYFLPEAWKPPYEPATLDPDVRFVDPAPEKMLDVKIAYVNALRYLDEQIGKVLDALAADGLLDDAVIAVYGENGESFGEGGRALHAAEPVSAALRVACVLHAPGLVPPGIDDYPTSLVDVVPTILGSLGFGPAPGFQGVDVLVANRPPAGDRLLFVHVNTPLALADGVVQGGRWLFTYDARRLTERLVDVEADPLGRQNLVDAEPAVASRLRRALDAWRARQLAYYAFPFYYRNYWPPAPPALPSS